MFPAGRPRDRTDCTSFSTSNMSAIRYVRGNELDQLMHYLNGRDCFLEPDLFKIGKPLDRCHILPPFFGVEVAVLLIT